MPFFSSFTGRTPISKISPFAKPPSPIPLYSKHLPLKTVKSTRPKLSLRTLPSVRMINPPTTGWAAFLYHCFKLMLLAFLSSIIGLTSHLVSELLSNCFSVPLQLRLALACACICTAYVVTSYLLHCCGHSIRASAAFYSDFVCGGLLFGVSACLDTPVAYLSCGALPKQGNTANFIHSLFANAENGTYYNHDWVVDPSKTSCNEIMAIFSLSWVAAGFFLLSGIFAAVCANLQLQRDDDRKRRDGFSGGAPIPKVQPRAQTKPQGYGGGDGTAQRPGPEATV